MKKILVIVPRYFPDTSAGGPIFATKSFAKLLFELGYNVKLLTLNTSNLKNKFGKIDGVDVVYYKLNKIFNNLSKSGWGFSLDFTFNIIKEIKWCDVIYVRSFWNYISLITFILNIFFRKKLIFSVNGKFSKYALKSSSWKKKIAFFFIKPFLANYTVQYASYDEMKNVSLNYLRKLKSIVIPNAVIDNKIVLKKQNHNKQINFYSVSRIDQIKNIDYSLQELSKSELMLTYSIFGDYNNEYGRKLINLSTTLFDEVIVNNNVYFKNKKKAKKTVNFYGWMNSNEIYRVVDDNFIFLQMSYSEGLSNSVIQAISLGIRCVVSTGCQMSSLAKKNIIKEIETNNGSLKNIVNNANKLIMNKKQLVDYYKYNYSRNAVRKKISELI